MTNDVYLGRLLPKTNGLTCNTNVDVEIFCPTWRKWTVLNAGNPNAVNSTALRFTFRFYIFANFVTLSSNKRPRFPHISFSLVSEDFLLVLYSIETNGMENREICHGWSRSHDQRITSLRICEWPEHWLSKKKKTEENWDFSLKKNKMSLNFHQEFYFCEV